MPNQHVFFGCWLARWGWLGCWVGWARSVQHNIVQHCGGSDGLKSDANLTQLSLKAKIVGLSSSLSRAVEDVASAIDERPDFQGQKATFLVHGGGKS
jgi:hypothetical protein